MPVESALVAMWPIRHLPLFYDKKTISCINLILMITPENQIIFYETTIFIFNFLLNSTTQASYITFCHSEYRVCEFKFYHVQSTYRRTTHSYFYCCDYKTLIYVLIYILNYNWKTSTAGRRSSLRVSTIAKDFTKLSDHLAYTRFVLWYYVAMPRN